MEAAGVFAVFGDAFLELFGGFGSEAGELFELAGGDGGFELVDVGDLEDFPEERDGFGAHAGELEELEHGGFVFGEKFFAEGEGSGLLDLLRYWRPCLCRCRGFPGVFWGRRR